MDKTWQQLVAEFVGTLALIFIGAGSVVMADLGGGLVGVALAHGLVLFVVVSVTGHVSGGHINPAVTIGVWVAGKIGTTKAVAYVVAQLAGAAVGGLLLRAALPESLWGPVSLGTPLVDETVISAGRGVLVEAILTFFLVFAVFGTAVDERGPFGKIAGLPIGLVLTFDILVGGPLTGAAMNPARTFGPAVASTTWTNHWVYWVGPVAGGVIAASLYWFAFLRTEERVAVSPPQ